MKRKKQTNSKALRHENKINLTQLIVKEMTLQQLSKRLQSYICPKKYEITKTAMLSSMKERTISRKVNVYTNITMYCIDYPVK